MRENGINWVTCDYNSVITTLWLQLYDYNCKRVVYIKLFGTLTTKYFTKETVHHIKKLEGAGFSNLNLIIHKYFQGYKASCTKCIDG